MYGSSRSSTMLSMRMKRRPVELMNCHMPAAPTFERAAGLNDDSTCGNDAISRGSPASVIVFLT